MPRGVYARKSAQRKTAGKGKAKARAKVTPKAGTSAAPAAAPQAQPQFSRDDFRMAIDDMELPRLRAYARSIGIMARDVEHLTEDRLRQNCKARILQSFEDA